MFSSELFCFLLKNPEAANALAALGSMIIAGVATLISIIALIFTVYSARHQKKHNQLSVRPLGYITVGDYENHLHVTIKNHGTGPLIIQEIRVLGADDPEKPLIKCMPELPANLYWSDFIEEYTNRSIPINDGIKLIEFSTGNTPLSPQFKKARDLIRKALGELEIKVTYTDIYGSNSFTTSRKLDWFHRLLKDTNTLGTPSKK